jgi:4-aminobutyrate aminotransferase-like enzyme
MGSYLIDSDGRRYLDATAAYGVAAIGHAHPMWVSAVQDQVARLAASPFHTPQLGAYLEALAAILPGNLQRIALFSGGSEAVEVAVRIAQRATGRPDVLSFTTAFHGKSAGVRYTGGANGEERFALSVRRYPHVTFPACERHSATAYPYCDESAAPACAELTARADLDDVGAVIVEPVLGTAGNIPPMPDLLSELRQLCNRRGWLLIADESITGFGRTGTLFACQRFGTMPDIVVLGKAVGGGYPLSAVAASADLWRESGMDRPSTTSSSYGANPLACAAGLAALEIITGTRFLTNVRHVAAYLAAGVDQLARATSAIARPRGIGMMLGFDLVDQSTGSLASPTRCVEVFRSCRNRGLLLPVDVPRVRINPPLTLSLTEAGDLLNVLHEVLT